MQSSIREILAHKGNRVVTVEAEATVRDAVARMNEHRIGSIVVLDAEGRLGGIFTERDVLTRVVQDHRDPDTTAVADVMTPNPTSIGPERSVSEVMRIMTSQRVRHIPVLERGAVIGLISIGDCTAWVTRELRAEVSDLQSYIAGPAARMPS